MVRALNTQWRLTPPPAIQLARIAKFLGITPLEPEPAPSADMHEQSAAALLDMFQPGPAPVVMSPEEYLRRKAERNNHGRE